MRRKVWSELTGFEKLWTVTYYTFAIAVFALFLLMIVRFDLFTAVFLNMKGKITFARIIEGLIIFVERALNLR